NTPAATGNTQDSALNQANSAWTQY
ncbi:unnamed protein product, partial [Rotaria sp. Silwood1]